MKIMVHIRRNAGGTYRTFCPMLPGCEVFASSREEATERMKFALKGYLANLEEILPRELSKKFSLTDAPRTGRKRRLKWSL